MDHGILPGPHFLKKFLQAELDAAIKADEIAQSELRRVCSTPNGGWPKAILDAGNIQDIARQALVLARIRFNDFVHRGPTPEALKSLDVPRERAARAS
jgi:hypothetical protein